MIEECDGPEYRRPMTQAEQAEHGRLSDEWRMATEEELDVMTVDPRVLERMQYGAVMDELHRIERDQEPDPFEEAHPERPEPC